MTLRTDHIAGGVFVAFGLLVFALSGDLPVGTLSFPGAGMMPKLVAGLVIVFGLLLILRANESAPFATIPWRDLPHAASHRMSCSVKSHALLHAFRPAC